MLDQSIILEVTVLRTMEKFAENTCKGWDWSGSMYLKTVREDG